MSEPVKQDGKRWQKVTIIILSSLSIALAGIYGYIHFFSMPAGAELAPRPGLMYQLDPFYVNLAEERQRAILKVVVVLELTAASKEEDIELYQPILRDDIINIFRGYSVYQLQEEESYTRLKVEIKDAVNKLLPEEGVASVYFTDFLISH